LKPGRDSAIEPGAHVGRVAGRRENHVQPFMLAGGTNIARLVLPQALGKAPQT
jgi:hypothetical protein